MFGLPSPRRNDRTGGEPKLIVEIVKSPRHSTFSEPGRTSMITFKPDDLINRTYLTQPDEDGQRFWAKIVQQIIDNKEALEQKLEHVKFLVQVEGDKSDEIVAYNDILDFLEEEMSEPAEQLWQF